ncbi:MAG: hypothetical protein Q4F29_11080 [Lachnospiraceae bacterium]|nr:hypothetical protein [Lachnospiraceae bacterium]
MKKRHSFISILLAAGLLASLVPSAAYAREKISQVSLSFSLNKESEDWNLLDVESDGEGYEVRKVDLFPEGLDKKSSQPYAVVILDAEDEYYFSSIKEKYFTLEGEGAVFDEAARSNSNSTMTLAVHLKELGEGELEDPENLTWNGAGIASWEPVYGAASYSVRLCRDGKPLGAASAPKTDVSVYNLSTKITRTGNYYFQIKANGRFKNTKSSQWVNSPTLSVDEDTLAFIREHASEDTGKIGQWFTDDKGTWYQYTTGYYPRSQWARIDKFWYYFNDEGYMVTGQWVDRYYVGGDGKMLTDTITPDGYYVDETGCWAPK